MKPTLAVVLAALALGACRNYTHFERTASVHDDAGVQMDGGHGEKTSCVLEGRGDLGANPAVGIDTETQHVVTDSPTSVALVWLPSRQYSTALGLYSGIGTTTLLQVDDINGPANNSADHYDLTLHASSFAATLAPDGNVHVIIVTTGTKSPVYYTSEYIHDGVSLTWQRTVTWSELPASVAFGDLDADGHPDLLVGFGDAAGSSASQYIVVYPGTGYKSSTGLLLLGDNSSRVPLISANPAALLSFRGGATPQTVFLAVLQQAVSNSTTNTTSKLELLKFTGSFDASTQVSLSSLTSLPTQTTTMTAADIDNDGQDDLVLGGVDVTGMNSLFAITKLGGTMVLRTIAVDGSVFGLQRIDWNQDGADDLFLWRQPSTMASWLVPTILQNRGGGRFDTQLPATGINPPSFAAAPLIQSPVAQACPPRLVFSDTVNKRISVYSPGTQQ